MQSCLQKIMQLLSYHTAINKTFGMNSNYQNANANNSNDDKK